jgi:small subunit ribosomal protein S13
MSYILSTEIPERKSIKVALSRIFGIGRRENQKICLFVGVSKKTKIGFLNFEIKNRILNYVEKNLKINEELATLKSQSKEKEIQMKSYKGQRAKLKLPRRGQRTHTNAQTCKKVF